MSQKEDMMVKKYAPGEKFEQDCLKFLQKNFHHLSPCVSFDSHGSAMDSTGSDISVFINGDYHYDIEVKSTKAQCGQFVVHYHNDSNNFIYSEKNKTPLNDSSSRIVHYMNENLTEFNKPTSRGIPLSCDSSLFYDWIIEHYRGKNVHFFMSSYQKNFIIFPLEKIHDYCYVTATYRKKKSGSSKPPLSLHKHITSLISSSYQEYSPIISIGEDNHFIVKTVKEIPSYNLNFYCDDSTLYFSLREVLDQYYVYEVRKLSSTCNANVIFSLEVKQQQDPHDWDAFVSSLQEEPTKV